MNKSQGTLYLVATPIGNLKDISQRAIDILTDVTLIAAEDTRHTAYLLNHLGIGTPTISLHEYNESERIEQITTSLKSGNDIALVSDAGTPLICDPGYKLVREARQQNLTVSPVPGCCAFVAALSASGIATDSFIFEGFLPAKQQARKSQIEQVQEQTRTVVFYESKHRIHSALDDLLSVLGAQRRMTLAKELTKSFEQFVHGTIPEVQRWLKSSPDRQKGEFVLVIEGNKKTEQSQTEIDRILDILTAELPLKQAAGLAAKLLGEKKNKLYKLALARKAQ